jgi:hypothetical protein
MASTCTTRPPNIPIQRAPALQELLKNDLIALVRQQRDVIDVALTRLTGGDAAGAAQILHSGFGAP